MMNLRIETPRNFPRATPASRRSPSGLQSSADGRGGICFSVSHSTDRRDRSYKEAHYRCGDCKLDDEIAHAKVPLNFEGGI
jgi:hypothetical protein